MANEDSALREVDQELAEDEQWANICKYGPALVGAAIALVVGVGGWQIYQNVRTAAAETQAVEFSEAIETLTENTEDGRAQLEAIAEENKSGYAVLARFRQASSLASGGEIDEAEALFQQIYSQNSAPKSLRELARIRAAQLALDDGRDDVLAHLGELARSDSAFRFHADELNGIAALAAQDYETAHSVFTRLIGDPETPPSLLLRAEEFQSLAVAGKAGVNLTGEIQLDDILGAVGDGNDSIGLEDLATNGGEIIDDHSGHDHAEGEGHDDAAHADDESIVTDENGDAETQPEGETE